MNALVSVIIPVYNRRTELERCLQSIRNQTYENFEAIIIDDASTMDLRDIVDNMHDHRFIFFRNKENGGPYNARTIGWMIGKGDYFVNLDSDDEAYPWMLQRAVYYFNKTPQADAVTGMYIRYEDSRLLARVSKREKLVTPEVAAVLPGTDCIAVIRRPIIEEWLMKSHDYYALEAHAWIAFSLKHSQLYVDEPWALNNTNSSNRVSNLLLRKNVRHINDCLLFMIDYDDILLNVHNREDIDLLLIHIAKTLLKGLHWKGLRRAFYYMRKRKLKIATVLKMIVINRIRSRLGLDRNNRQEVSKIIWID